MLDGREFESQKSLPDHCSHRAYGKKEMMNEMNCDNFGTTYER